MSVENMSFQRGFARPSYTGLFENQNEARKEIRENIDELYIDEDRDQLEYFQKLGEKLYDLNLSPETIASEAKYLDPRPEDEELEYTLAEIVRALEEVQQIDRSNLEQETNEWYTKALKIM